MPVFFFFNHDVANLFAPGNDRPAALRHRDLSFLFPFILFMGSLSGIPQLVLPLGLYMLFGNNVNALENLGGSWVAKFCAFFAIAFIIFSDFFPSFVPLEHEHRIHREPGHSRVTFQDEYMDDGVVGSIFSEMSLVLIISVTLAIISHWEDVHAWIARSLPRAWGRRFRQFTRTLGIHPTNSTQGLRPASAEAMASLENVAIVNSNQGDCSICLESFKIGERAKRLPCKHMFHGSCLDPWLSQRSSCPVCRASVERSEDDDQASNNRPQTSRSDANGGLNAVWNALRSVLDPAFIFNQGLAVEDRNALMQLSIRELRERASARNIPLRGVIEKSEIVDMLMQSQSTSGRT